MPRSRQEKALNKKQLLKKITSNKDKSCKPTRKSSQNKGDVVLDKKELTTKHRTLSQLIKSKGLKNIKNKVRSPNRNIKHFKKEPIYALKLNEIDNYSKKQNSARIVPAKKIAPVKLITNESKIPPITDMERKNDQRYNARPYNRNPNLTSCLITRDVFGRLLKTYETQKSVHFCDSKNVVIGIYSRNEEDILGSKRKMHSERSKRN